MFIEPSENNQAPNTYVRRDARKLFKGDRPIIAECKTIDGEFQGVIKDVSASGVFIVTDYDLTVGQEVAMTFTFPASKKTIMATGEVARKSRAGVAVEIKVFFKV
jgi:hypothetical protein